MMKKISKKQKITIVVTILVLIIILSTIITVNVIENRKVANTDYLDATANAGSTLVASYIKNGITIGGITGTLEVLDTSDATATPEDILEGKTAYVNGVKITGTKKRPFYLDISYTTESITIKVLTDFGEGAQYEYFINGESQGKTLEKEYTISIELENKTPYIPTGFEHTEGEIDTGYVIKDTSIGNEFVWVPVKAGTFDVYVEATDNGGYVTKSDETTLKISELTREPEYSDIRYTDWYEDDGDVNDKKSIAYFKNSVLENCGFYMGRYEMGMPGQVSGEAPTLEIDERNVSGIPVCIGNVIPWINIDYETAKSNLESMYNGEVQSAMMNSYARTTTLNWVNSTSGINTSGNYSNTTWYDNSSVNVRGYYETPDYGISEQIQNYTSTFDLGGAGVGLTILLCTGADIQNGNQWSNNNIYDLGGNAEEWSTEIFNSNSEHRKSGGGFQQDENAHSIIDSNTAFSGYGLTASYSTSSRPILYK